MSKKIVGSLPDLKNYLPTKEAWMSAQQKGLGRSLVWFKLMVWKKRIGSIDLNGRKWIHKDEIDRVVKERPTLRLSDIAARQKVA